MSRCDTHVHLWQHADGEPIRIRERVRDLDGDFGLCAFTVQARAAGVDSIVLVSAAQTETDTDRLLEVARANPGFVRGVMGWLDLTAPDFEARLAARAADPAWLGHRLPLVLTGSDWLDQPSVRHSLRLLNECSARVQILLDPGQVKAVRDCFVRYPELRLILDHAANPTADGTVDPVWRDGLAAMADLPNICCKVSSFWLPGDPTPMDETIRPLLSHVLDRFGPARVIAAGNWPISTLATPYSQVLARLDRLADLYGLETTERAAILHGNAAELFPTAQHKLEENAWHR